MIVSYSQIVGSQVLSIEEQSSIGRVSDIVLQKSDIKVKAVLLGTAVFFVTPRVVTFDDIVDFDSRAVVIQKEDDAVSLAEVVSIKQAIKAGMKGVRHKVYTKAGKLVGTVYDYTLDSTSGLIYSLYIRHLLSERIIPRTVICELNDKGFIIDDDFELVRNTAPYPEQA